MKKYCYMACFLLTTMFFSNFILAMNNNGSGGTKRTLEEEEKDEKNYMIFFDEIIGKQGMLYPVPTEELTDENGKIKPNVIDLRVGDSKEIKAFDVNLLKSQKEPVYYIAQTPLDPSEVNRIKLYCEAKDSPQPNPGVLKILLNDYYLKGSPHLTLKQILALRRWLDWKFVKEHIEFPSNASSLESFQKNNISKGWLFRESKQKDDEEKGIYYINISYLNQSEIEDILVGYMVGSYYFLEVEGSEKKFACLLDLLNYILNYYQDKNKLDKKLFYSNTESKVLTENEILKTLFKTYLADIKPSNSSSTLTQIEIDLLREKITWEFFKTHIEFPSKEVARLQFNGSKGSSNYEGWWVFRKSLKGWYYTTISSLPEVLATETDAKILAKVMDIRIEYKAPPSNKEYFLPYYSSTNSTTKFYFLLDLLADLLINPPKKLPDQFDLNGKMFFSKQ